MTPTHTPFPPSHLTPSTLLHPVTASGAASFCCRLAATPHQRGARNIVAIGAVSPPNKTALMELLFDLLCFVFCELFRAASLQLVLLQVPVMADITVLYAPACVHELASLLFSPATETVTRPCK